MAAEATAHLRWLGHACFLLRSPTGVHVLIDPLNDALGYPAPALPEIDLVLVSHEHADHANVQLAPGRPKVVRGVSADLWHAGEVRLGDVTVTVIAGAYHDDVQGAARGRTALLSVAVGDIRLLHLGDLGHVLDANLIAQTRGHDIVCVPVGGHFTLDGAGAAEVIDQIAPRVAIPMHYRPADREMPLPIATLEHSGFLSGRTVHRMASSRLDLAPDLLPDALEVMVLELPVPSAPA